MHDLGLSGARPARRAALRHLLVAAAGLRLPAMSSPAHAATTGERDWLADAGRYLYVTRPTRFSSEVESWRDGAVLDTAKVEVYVGDFSKEGGGSAKTLVKFTEEGIRKGRLILYEGDRAWMYFRGTQQAIRVPLGEQLVGDADVASVLNVDLRENYQVTDVQHETQQGKSIATLTLSPRRNDAPFGSAVLKVDAGNAQPLQLQYRTLSGKLAKTIDYLGFQPYQGEHVLQSVRIKVFLNARSDYTLIRYPGVAAYELPRRFFNPALLKDF